MSPTHKFKKLVKNMPKNVISNLIRLHPLKSMPVSDGYELLMQENMPSEPLAGWRESDVAEKQHAAFIPLIQQMYSGKCREDFLALSNAVKMTGLHDPLVIEVGCGSGWNSEVLNYLLKSQIKYIGLDYSLAMTALGKRSYPDKAFIAGDAAMLPIKDRACDILISGTVLMHLLGYRKAIRESRRVTRQWCIFHTVPVLKKRKTTILRKIAYGKPTIEVIFNEQELYQMMEESGLTIYQVLKSIPYNLETLLGEPTVTKTYICEVS